MSSFIKKEKLTTVKKKNWIAESESDKLMGGKLP